LASVGVAHTQSLDDNHGHQYRVWPRPIAAPGYENNWLDYGYGRYAGLTIPGFPQGEFTGQDGNALPSAFIDDVNPSGDKYLYVLYTCAGSRTSSNDGKIHIARAKLGGHGPNERPEKLQFKKWYKGGWNAPSIQTQMASLQDDGIDPPGCGNATGPSGNRTASMVYNEALGL